MTLAQFVPLDLKIKEIYTIEQAKLSAAAPWIPDEYSLEPRVEPQDKPHPVKRKSFEHVAAQTQEEVDAECGQINIYTDGSKLETDEVGAAFVVYHGNDRPTIRKFKMAEFCTVFQAELYAIHRALDWLINRRPAGSITLYSDSQAALAAIEQRNSSHPLTVAIQATARRIEETAEMKFVWVKAHVGIVGNEAADVAAKTAATLRTAASYDDFPISYFKRIAKESTAKEWEKRYQASTTGAITKHSFPTQKHAAAYHAVKENKFETTQIFTGHSFARSYLHRFKVTSDSAACPCDQASPQTIRHLIEECPRYVAARYLYEGSCAEHHCNPFDFAKVLGEVNLVEAFFAFSTNIISTLKSFVMAA